MELSEAARQARNKYSREYRRKNPDKIKRYNDNYWERKAMEANSGESALDRAIKYHCDSDEPIEVKVLKLHRQGFSLREIAAKTGINHVKVSRILKSI